MAAVIGFFFNRHIVRVERGLDDKANKSEIAELKSELREAREAREKDMERMDRLANERYAELKGMFDQRLTDLEKHLSDKLTMILRQVEKKNAD
ncbi:MAG: hypothetical protein JO253_02865 [Alphaproteobacteria bacterium]|nr:hypothetical protein [Alphaproteobacteria bacterium]